MQTSQTLFIPFSDSSVVTQTATTKRQNSSFAIENQQNICISHKNIVPLHAENNNFKTNMQNQFVYSINAPVAELCEKLESIGRITSEFDGKKLIPLLTHPNENVRISAVKVIGRLKSIEYVNTLYTIAREDSSTRVKREAVSSIGRLRSYEVIDKLIEMTQDNDPKVVCQAIRGLLVFKGTSNVDETLKSLIVHPNEMIKSVIQKEYFSNSDIKKSSLKHTESYPFMQNVIVNADVLETLKCVPDESIHLTFTSPPYYNARDYSIYKSYQEYLNFLQKVFEETHRITKEGRFLVVNTSPVIVPRISRSHSSKRYPIPFDLHTILVNQGWEFIDDIIWQKPEYSVKNRVGGFQQHRKPLGYKPNSVTEYLMVYRKKTDRLLDWNIHQYPKDIVEDSKVFGNFDTSNVWFINPKADKVHSAVFPEELCKRVIQYYSFKGDLVFDPFGGSGTLSRTARSMNRHFFLTEIEKKYVEYMKTLENSSVFYGKKTQYLTLEEFKKNIIL